MKIRHLIIFGLIGLLFGISSCRDDFDYDIASKELSFSSDTLNLDTIFNYTNSQTYKLIIHNNQNKDIQIPRIYLSRGESSFFKINVDGMPGYNFENVAIRKKDSIFVFVEIAAGEVPSNPLYEDEINLETDAGNQQVKLMAYIEKAKFYNTEESDNYQLDESNWDNEYSRVIFGKVNANHLNINSKTKIYFHKNAELNINGLLNVNGSLGNEVIFRTDRMDERSDSLPDQWGKIKIKSNGNFESSINYAIIKSANIGLEIQDSKLNIKNTKILNSQEIGLYSRNSIVRGENIVISHCNLASLAVEGGDVQFIHSTFANYFNIGQGGGGNYCLYLGNVDNSDNNIPLEKANFYNCIFYGRSLNAVIFDNGGSTFNHSFKNNVIRLDYPDEVSGIDNTNIIDKNPEFKNPGFGKNDFRLLTDSPVLGIGDPVWSVLVPFDILNQSRTALPTPGAYQNPVEP